MNEVTDKEKIAWNRMLSCLIRIAREYQSPSKIRRNASKQWGLEYMEALEYSYENIQSDAKLASKGLKFMLPDKTDRPSAAEKGE